MIFFSFFFLHFWQCYASTVFFTQMIIKIMFICHICGNSFQIKCYIKKTFAKKSLNFFGFLLGVLDIWDIFYKNPKLYLMASFPVITHLTYTCLSPWALLLIFIIDLFYREIFINYIICQRSGGRGFLWILTEKKRKGTTLKVQSIALANPLYIYLIHQWGGRPWQKVMN